MRGTAKESEVVPNLMQAFNLDEIQAEYIAEIKLRHLNREYIMDRIKEIENLKAEIADLEAIIGDDLKVKAEIAKQLTEIKKKYAKPRKTQLIGDDEIEVATADDFVANYNATASRTRSTATTLPRCCLSPTAAKCTRHACATLTRSRRRRWATFCPPSSAWATVSVRLR